MQRASKPRLGDSRHAPVSAARNEFDRARHAQHSRPPQKSSQLVGRKTSNRNLAEREWVEGAAAGRIRPRFVHALELDRWLALNQDSPPCPSAPREGQPVSRVLRGQARRVRPPAARAGVRPRHEHRQIAHGASDLAVHLDLNLVERASPCAYRVEITDDPAHRSARDASRSSSSCTSSANRCVFSDSAAALMNTLEGSALERSDKTRSTSVVAAQHQLCSKPYSRMTGVATVSL